METRGARRAVILERALEPLAGKLDREALERLRIALAVMIGGGGSVIGLEDILGLDRESAEETMDWALRALVRAAAND